MIGYCNKFIKVVISEADCFFCKDVSINTNEIVCKYWSECWGTKSYYKRYEPNEEGEWVEV